MPAHAYESALGRVAYAKRGWGDPLLLVHGVYPGASHEEFDRLLDRLADRCTVYAPDLPGFGASDKPRMTYTAQTYHHLLRDFIIEAIGRPCAVAAAGAGCAFAVHLAVYNDALLSRLSLIDPSATPPAHEGPGLFDRLQQWLLGTLTMGQGLYETMATRTEIRRLLSSRVHNRRTITRALLDRLHEQAAHPDALYPYVSWLCGYLSTDVFRWLRSVRRPVQVLWGEHAGEPPREALFRPAAWSQGRRLDLVPGAARLPHLEQSSKTVELLLEFLSD